MEIGNDTISVIIAKVPRGGKIFHQRHESYTFERPQIKLVRVDWISTRQEKMLQPQKGTF